MDPEVITNVVKEGETCISVVLFRNRHGLRVTVRSVPAVEEFFKNVGRGEAVDLRTIARKWVGTENEVVDGQSVRAPLNIYTLPIELGGSKYVGPKDGDGSIYYRLDVPGRDMIIQGDIPGNKSINMGFLRLVGISEGAGVSFNVMDTIYTLEQVQEIGRLISQAFRTIYNSYLKPVNLAVVVSTQEF